MVAPPLHQQQHQHQHQHQQQEIRYGPGISITVTEARNILQNLRDEVTRANSVSFAELSRRERLDMLDVFSEIEFLEYQLENVTGHGRGPRFQQ